jgi:hypothetical protein
MSLLCRVFHHKRSRSRASFDDVHECWVSECKRCFTVLVREGPGDWREAPPEPPRLRTEEPRILNSTSFTILEPRALESSGFTILAA